MAEIIDTSSSNKRKMAYIGQAQWASGTNQNLIEPNASNVANSLKNDGWIVEYYHAAGVGPEKQTNYSIKLDGDYTYPEKAEQDWKKAIARVRGAQSVHFGFNHDVRLYDD